MKKKVVLIELGVGFNTPSIIRFPFEKLAKENESYSLIRLNKNDPLIPECIKDRSVSFIDDIVKVINSLIGVKK